MLVIVVIINTINVTNKLTLICSNTLPKRQYTIKTAILIFKITKSINSFLGFLFKNSNPFLNLLILKNKNIIKNCNDRIMNKLI